MQKRTIYAECPSLWMRMKCLQFIYYLPQFYALAKWD